MGVWRRVTRFIFPSTFLRTAVAPVLGEMPSIIVPNHAHSLPRYAPSEAVRSGLMYAGRLVPEKGVHIFYKRWNGWIHAFPLPFTEQVPWKKRYGAIKGVFVFWGR